MKEILMNGVIGYGWDGELPVTLDSVVKQTADIDAGEEMLVVINSPGGDLYEGIRIFNFIHDLAKLRTVSVRINCMAMSAASYIAFAPRTGNSIVMIHNPWSIDWGDYRAFRKAADLLERQADVLCVVYAAVMEKPEKVIRALMDEETYYFGCEITESGFANDFEELSQDQDQIIIKADFKAGHEKLVAAARRESEKIAAAMFGSLGREAAMLTRGSEQHGGSYCGAAGRIEKNRNTGGSMTIEELKAQHPGVYDAGLPGRRGEGTRAREHPSPVRRKSKGA
ncbi:MAG: Clp protease ClpP [Spirochaetota bacterium]|jgi:ATP-dependent protease ClpP protease subunit|nr:Clp protease ClpP [Spirochaetota bacterium]